MPRQTQTTRARQSGPQSVHLGRFDGVNNVLPITDIKPTELSSCTNFDMDRAGRVSVRPGRAMFITGDWSAGVSPDRSVGVKDKNLVLINPDQTTAVICAGVGNNPMSFAAYNGYTYYTNKVIIGYVADGVSHNFVAPTDGFHIMVLPGQIIGFYKARMFVCRDNEMMFTEVGHFNQVEWDEKNGIFGVIAFPAEIIMWVAVDDGIFVSTTEKIYYLGGSPDPTSPEGMTQREVADYPALPGAYCLVDSQLFGLRKEDHLYGKTVVMNTAQGLCWGTNQGVFGNIAARKYVGPSGTRGAAIYRPGTINQVICVVS